jgi:hypothetical protein
MATSGKLAHELAEVLGVSKASIDSSVKSLRTAGLISSTGRGSSAADMTSDDASTLLIGIGSGASGPYVAAVTEILKKMQLTLSLKTRVPGIRGLRDLNNLFFLRSGGKHTFFEGINALLRAEWAQPSNNEADRKPFNPLDYPSRLAILIGTNGRKDGGFAVIHTISTNGFAIKNYYSTWPMRPDRSEYDFDLLDIFETPTQYFSITHYGGKVLATAIRTLRQPTNRTRNRQVNVARLSQT